MLKQASVSDLITDRVSPGPRSHVVIAMRRYPRFVNRRLRDEYQPSLASDTRLFEDWLSTKRRTGDHDGAFGKARFEERFELDEEGMRHLERLSAMSRDRDVYLVCQCARGLRCHREMVLLLAKERFGTEIEEVRNSYPRFLEKIRAHARPEGCKPSSSTKRRPSSMQQVYSVLKADHKLVKQILKQLDSTRESDVRKRAQLLRQLKEALVPHARAEEEVLYDRLKDSDVQEADDLAFEAYEEHAVVDRLLEQLEATAPNDKRWTALLSVAKEALEHHIEEEEEALFEKAKKSFDRATAISMTEEFMARKAEILKRIKSGRTPGQKPSNELVEAA